MTDSKPAANSDHLGTALKVFTAISFLVGGGFGLIRIGIWIAQVQAPPIPVQVPPELAAEVGACRELARILRAGPLPKETP
jgi:hypothetical protein